MSSFLMMNTARFAIILLTCLESLGCEAQDLTNLPWKIYKSEKLHCGDVVVGIESQCYDPDEKLKDRGSGGILRQCKNANMIISHDSRRITKSLPYLPDEQWKALEASGYKLEDIMKNGQWSPYLLMCVTTDKPRILMSYITSGKAELEDYSKNSLVKKPVIINLDGSLADESSAKDATEAVAKDSYFHIPGVDVNGVYGDETKFNK